MVESFLNLPWTPIFLGVILINIFGIYSKLCTIAEAACYLAECVVVLESRPMEGPDETDSSDNR